MTICSITKGYCFQEQYAIVSLLFCNLKIPKQGIKMQIFPKRVVETLKNGDLPVKLHSSAPPPGENPFTNKMAHVFTAPSDRIMFFINDTSSVRSFINVKNGAGEIEELRARYESEIIVRPSPKSEVKF